MKVLLDNGHGVDTAGKGSPWALNKVKPELYLREWEYNRKVVNAVYDELKKRGIDCVKLVTEDRDISLPERVRRANNIYKKDKDSFLVSVHVNAAGSGRQWLNASHWSVYTCVGKTRSDIIADYLWNAAVRNFPGKKIKSDRTDGDNDCEANFYILKNTACPAILTENFFQDSIKDVEFLLSDAGFKAVVKCHVDGIMDYIKAYNNDKK